MTNATELLRIVGLAVGGTIRWGDRVPSPGAGVYIVETPEPMAGLPPGYDTANSASSRWGQKGLSFPGWPFRAKRGGQYP